MPQTGSPYEETGKRALVVEDDLFFSVRIETTLSKLGYTVEVVTEGAQAVASAEALRPDLVIVNFGRDRLNPAETVRKLKSLPNPAPVLGFVPHVSMPQVRPAAIAAGCDLLVANSALTLRLPQLAAKLVSPRPSQEESASRDQADADEH